MKRQDILDRLIANRTKLEARGVKSVALFGSAVRGEETDTRDVDLLVEFDQPTGLLGLIKLKHELQEMLEVENVDLITRDGLHPALKERILSEAVDAI
jgi:uncharacterized protein